MQNKDTNVFKIGATRRVETEKKTAVVLSFAQKEENLQDPECTAAHQTNKLSE